MKEALFIFFIVKFAQRKNMTLCILRLANKGIYVQSLKTTMSLEKDRQKGVDYE